MRRLLAILTVSILACSSVQPARACLWDSDTVRTEREFQQNYEFKSGESPPDRGDASPGSFSLSWFGLTVAGAGIGLMAASAGFVFFNQRKIVRT